MNTPVRTHVIPTGEIFINLNDLIIKMMVLADHAKQSEEAEAIKKVIEYLVQKRDKAHVSQ